MVTPARGATRPAQLAVILLGGAAGTAVRAGLAEVWRTEPGAWPWTTFGVNASGALLLGLVLQLLADTGPDEGARRLWRLGLGTGLLGGYTTYSTFAVETVGLLGPAAWPVGLAYAVATVVLGVAAAWAGAALARMAHRWHRRGSAG